MSTFGKVVAVLNLLAAGAFLYLMASTLQRRQAWSYAIWRYDLAIDGLPVDREEPDDKGKPRHENMPDTVVKEATGDETLRTQEEILEKRKAEVLNRVEDQNIKGSKVDKIIDCLLPLARTAQERDQLTTLKQNQANARYPELLARFDAYFQAAKAMPNSQPRDREAKKRYIALLLLNLMDVLPNEEEKQQQAEELKKKPEERADPTASPAYRLVLNTVGLKNMAHALDDQAFNFLELDYQTTVARDQERLNFAQQLDALLDLLIRREHDLAERLTLLEGKKVQAGELEKRADAQEGNVKRVGGQLKDAQDRTAAELEKEARMLELLYQVRVRLRDANRVNQELERKIRELERKVRERETNRP
jgi:hypothetical protein